MTRYLIRCKRCNLLPEDHHDFEPQMPPGCVCPPAEWMGLIDGSIATPCKAFVESEYDDCRCAECEHELGCHK